MRPPLPPAIRSGRPACGCKRVSWTSWSWAICRRRCRPTGRLTSGIPPVRRCARRWCARRPAAGSGRWRSRRRWRQGRPGTSSSGHSCRCWSRCAPRRAPGARWPRRPRPCWPVQGASPTRRLPAIWKCGWPAGGRPPGATRLLRARPRRCRGRQPRPGWRATWGRCPGPTPWPPANRRSCAGWRRCSGANRAGRCARRCCSSRMWPLAIWIRCVRRPRWPWTRPTPSRCGPRSFSGCWTRPRASCAPVRPRSEKPRPRNRPPSPP